MKQALILFAHGARDPEWAGPIRQVQALAQLAQPGVAVEVAFLEFMAPSLPDCLARLDTAGVQRVAIVPMFIAQGGHLKTELPQMINLLKAKYPHVEFTLSGPIGEQARVIESMANVAVELAGLSLA